MGAGLGLEGDCCPTSNGDFLLCCSGSLSNSNSTDSSEKAKTSAGNNDAACKSNPGCIGLGLEGDCCPTSFGDFLDCCTLPSSSSSSSSNKNKKVSTTNGGAASSTTISRTKTDGSKTGSSSLSSCKGNLGCSNLNLQGDCCPASNGSFLSCCTEVEKSTQSVSSSSKCADNSACAALSLKGQCCPTSSGYYFKCCTSDP